MYHRLPLWPRSAVHIAKRACSSSALLGSPVSTSCSYILSSNCSPDKNPGVKGVQERFARLGVVASILRSEEGRERSVSRGITTLSNKADVLP